MDIDISVNNDFVNVDLSHTEVYNNETRNVSFSSSGNSDVCEVGKILAKNEIYASFKNLSVFDNYESSNQRNDLCKSNLNFCDIIGVNELVIHNSPVKNKNSVSDINENKSLNNLHKSSSLESFFGEKFFDLIEGNNKKKNKNISFLNAPANSETGFGFNSVEEMKSIKWNKKKNENQMQERYNIGVQHEVNKTYPSLFTDQKIGFTSESGSLDTLLSNRVGVLGTNNLKLKENRIAASDNSDFLTSNSDAKFGELEEEEEILLEEIYLLTGGNIISGGVNTVHQSEVNQDFLKQIEKSLDRSAKNLNLASQYFIEYEDSNKKNQVTEHSKQLTNFLDSFKNEPSISEENLAKTVGQCKIINSLRDEGVSFNKSNCSLTPETEKFKQKGVLQVERVQNKINSNNNNKTQSVNIAKYIIESLLKHTFEESEISCNVNDRSYHKSLEANEVLNNDLVNIMVNTIKKTALATNGFENIRSEERVPLLSCLARYVVLNINLTDKGKFPHETNKKSILSCNNDNDDVNKESNSISQKEGSSDPANSATLEKKNGCKKEKKRKNKESMCSIYEQSFLQGVTDVNNLLKEKMPRNTASNNVVCESNKEKTNFVLESRNLVNGETKVRILRKRRALSMIKTNLPIKSKTARTLKGQKLPEGKKSKMVDFQRNGVTTQVMTNNRSTCTGNSNKSSTLCPSQENANALTKSVRSSKFLHNDISMTYNVRVNKIARKGVASPQKRPLTRSSVLKKNSIINEKRKMILRRGWVTEFRKLSKKKVPSSSDSIKNVENHSNIRSVRNSSNNRKKFEKTLCVKSSRRSVCSEPAPLCRIFVNECFGEQSIDMFINENEEPLSGNKEIFKCPLSCETPYSEKEFGNADRKVIKNKHDQNKNKRYVGKLGDCVVKIERMPLIDRLLPTKKDSLSFDPNICELCEPKRVFLSKTALVNHINESHISSSYNTATIVSKKSSSHEGVSSTEIKSTTMKMRDRKAQNKTDSCKDEVTVSNLSTLGRNVTVSKTLSKTSMTEDGKTNTRYSSNHFCEICSRRFLTAAGVVSHKKTHKPLGRANRSVNKRGEFKFDYNICDKRFNLCSDLVEHIFLHSLSPERERDILRSNINRFGNRQVGVLVQIDNEISPDDDDDWNDPFNCKSSSTSEKDSVINDTGKRQNIPCKCEECGRLFTIRSVFKRHRNFIKKVAILEEETKRPMCKLEVKYRCQLESHKTSVKELVANS